MSLVHEALQKAEREKQRKTGAAPAAPIAPYPTPATASAIPPRTLAAVSKAAHVPEIKPAAPASKPPKESSGLLTVLIACVALVAIVAIVFLVGRATLALRGAKEPGVAAAVPGGGPPPSIGRPPTDASGTDATTPASPPTASPDASAYKLSGIMRDPDGKFAAVVNGRVVYEGYYVDGATVKTIERNRLILDVAGREMELRLF